MFGHEFFPYTLYKLTLLVSLGHFTLKSDLNKVIFVLEFWEPLCENINITIIRIFKKNLTHKKYLKNNDFLLLWFGFIQRNVDKTLFFCKAVVTSYTLAYHM